MNVQIIIAEDSITDSTIAQATLRAFGYETEVFSDGESALSAIRRATKPVLALIDWSMPGADGVTVCKQVISDPPIHPVHTIIITSRDSNKDKAYALEHGAGDFIAKPFDPQVLRARVSVGVRLLTTLMEHRKSNARLLEYTKKIEIMAEERASQLVHADRLSTIGTLSAGIAHEINNPATFISVNISTLRRNAAILANVLENECNETNRKRAAMFLRTLPEMLDEMDNGIARIREIVTGLKTYIYKSTQNSQGFSINDCIENSLKLCYNRLKYNFEVQKMLNDVPSVRGVSQQIEQVLVNLIINAADAIDDTGKKGSITISSQYRNGTVTVTVADDGPGIPKNDLNSVFNPFFTTKPVGKGTGLGLSISANIIREHRGTIDVENRPEGGTEFRINIPAYIPEKEET